MSEDFFKFPSTPHLASVPGVDIRGDKILTPAERDDFLMHEIVVEEKVDGANLGISFDSEGALRIQNRGAWLHLPASGQWKKLEEWLLPRTDILFESLTDRFILFGEWCYARHSVVYDRLPDWFLGFDIYDRSVGRFYSSGRRDALCRKMNLAQVPVVARARFQFHELLKLQAKSNFSNQPAEGIYLRYDQDAWLVQRAKLVRPAFIQSVEQHWSRSGVKPNRLRVAVQ